MKRGVELAHDHLQRSQVDDKTALSRKLDRVDQRIIGTLWLGRRLNCGGTNGLHSWLLGRCGGLDSRLALATRAFGTWSSLAALFAARCFFSDADRSSLLW